MTTTDEKIKRLPAMVTIEEVSALRIDMARMESKIDVLATLAADTKELDERVRQLELHNAAQGGRTDTRSKIIEIAIGILLAIIGSGVWWQNLSPPA